MGIRVPLARVVEKRVDHVGHAPALVNGGYVTVAFTVVGAILGAWR